VLDECHFVPQRQIDPTNTTVFEQPKTNQPCNGCISGGSLQDRHAFQGYTAICQHNTQYMLHLEGVLTTILHSR
jgi:hypothetical protein